MASGDIYVPSGVAEIRDQFLRDIRLSAIQTGQEDPPVTPGTDWYMLGEGAGNLALIGFANGAIADRDRSYLTATGQELEEHRIALGLDPVNASGSSGKIKIEVLGPTTLTNGTEFLFPSGLRGEIVGTYINPVDGAEVDVRALSVGSSTNLPAGTIVRFVEAPTNISEEATVSVGEPLTNGTDEETDGRKRDRILNELRNKPAGGNWAHIRKIALDILGSVQDCYVYPALGGPSSALVVPARDFDPDAVDFTRAPSAAALATIRGAIHAGMPSTQEIVVQAAVDEPVDFSLLVTIPDSTLSGGNGQGWSDQSPWPVLVLGDANKVTISSVGAGNDTITVSAGTIAPPLAGNTHVAWWSRVDMKFTTALVITVAGGSGAWVLGLDRPLVSSDGSPPNVGDYISPAGQNLSKYGDAWVSIFRSLGPGESTTDVGRLPRAKRHPFATTEDPSGITTSVLLGLVRAFPDITDIAFGHAPQKTPTIPAFVSIPPNILIPRNFAIYAL